MSEESAALDIRTEQDCKRLVAFLEILNAASSTNELIRRAELFLQQSFGCDAATIRLADPWSSSSGEGRDPSVGFASDTPPRLPSSDGDEGGLPASSAPTACPPECAPRAALCAASPDSRAACCRSAPCSYELVLRGAPPDIPTEAGVATQRFVARIPLRAGRQCLGILRLEHGRSEPFAVDTLAELEHLTRHLQLALARTLALDRIAETATRYQELVASLEDLVFSLDLDGTILYASPAITRIYGFTPAEVIGKRFSEFVHPEDLAALSASYAQTLGGTIAPHEFRGIDKWGATHNLRSLSRACSHQGRVTGVNGIIVDITELRRAEAAGRDSERRYRSLFERSTLGIAHCHVVYEAERVADFIVVEANVAFETVTGLDNPTGKRISELIPNAFEANAALVGLCAHAAHGDAVEHIELHLEALRRWLDISAYCPQSDDIVVVFDVITERKRTEAQLVETSRRLERLAEVTQALSQARDLETIVSAVLQAARTLVGADGAAFILREGDNCTYIDGDADARLGKGRKFPVSDSIAGWAMIHREPVVIADTDSDPRAKREACGSTAVQSLAIVPVRSLEPVGAISAYWATPHRATEEEVRLLQTLAESTSIAIENVRALAEFEEARARTRAIYDHLPLPTFVWKRQGEGFALVDFNKAAETVTHGESALLLGARPEQLPHAIPGLAEDLAICLRSRSTSRRELDCAVPGSATRRRLVLTYGYIPTDMVILHTEDVTEQRQTEERLRLSQRLEAIGRLAGGIAHDFNNLLSVIISYSGFTIAALNAEDPVRADAEEIQRAARRAAVLTKQLLAFSRNQVLEPETIDLNKVVTGMEELLRRLLGEDIEIATGFADRLGCVRADLGQLEQLIMNLAVNARDAMPLGGVLTFETANVELDAEYAARHVAVKPGSYVMLCVSDTGIGMDANTREHIFEPFFTTKQKGKGTGLGLATAYGITKQSGGNIWAYSEPQHGTTFKVYLPRVDAPAPELRRRTAPAVTTGSETVLLVEDEEKVRCIAERILRSAGYHVMAAASGGAALSLYEQRRNDIDLLLTDVVMPQMSGPDLAATLVAQSPGLKILYMSGYTDTMIVRHGALLPFTNFLSKPFSASDLTRRVREVLDAQQSAP